MYLIMGEAKRGVKKIASFSIITSCCISNRAEYVSRILNMHNIQFKYIIIDSCEKLRFLIKKNFVSYFNNDL